MTRRNYHPGDTALVRVPLRPLDAVTLWHANGDASEDTVAAQRSWLAQQVDRPEVREALRIASPSLESSIEHWRSVPDSDHGRKLERALVKYLTRLATRSTPYGLCAGIAGAEIRGRGCEVTVEPVSSARRRTRLDNEVLFRLAQAIAFAPEGRAHLTWSPNTSLAYVAGRWRYAEARAGHDEALHYHLIAVEPTAYLDATIARARGGARLATLAEALAADEQVDIADARSYVDELVDAQVLVPSLGVMVTGAEPIDAMIGQLAAAGLVEAAAGLEQIRVRLAVLDERTGSEAIDGYDEVARMVEALFTVAGAPTKVERARLCQVDMIASVNARIGDDVSAEVERVVELLQRMTPRREDPRLADLRRAFRERWEGREVPLALVLDEEAGIGFGAASGPGSEGAPLLAGLPFAAASDGGAATWGARERWLLTRLTEVWSSGAGELVLGPRDQEALAVADPVRLPDAWSSLVRIGRRDDKLELLVEGGGGPSGARLLGRFCHLDVRVDAMVRAHLAAEEATRPDVIFAEVVHLAEGRTGNILCRPVLRQHEIVYLGRGGARAQDQVTIDDLGVSVRDDRVILRSRRLGREIVPRLTSAHNVAARGLGVYRFLAALQAQDGGAAGWSWGALADAPRLPRVRLGRTVVARAQWRIGEDDLVMLANEARAGRARGFAAVQALRLRLGLPRHVVLADGDNELWTDLDHALQVDALVATVGGRPGIVLVEAWPVPSDMVARGADGSYASEVVLAFIRTRGTATSEGPATGAPSAMVAAERRFAPGSRWLYAKLYGGVSSADRALREAVAPVVGAAIASGAARRWFFIRYADPHPHLRLRVEGEPGRLLAELVPALHAACEPLVADGSLWRLQLDTYEREIERYGGCAGIELCEELFGHDAEAALAIVRELEGDAGAVARWQLALVSAERLLTALGLDDPTRERVFRMAKDQLVVEHRAGGPLLRVIGERWRAQEARLSELLAPGRELVADEDLAPGLQALAFRDVAIAGVAGRLRALDRSGALVPGLEHFAWSLVHMSVNRLLHASARAQELVIYDLLRRWHGRQRARGRTSRGVAA